MGLKPKSITGDVLPISELLCLTRIAPACFRP